MKHAIFASNWLHRMMKASIILTLCTILLLAFSIRNNVEVFLSERLEFNITGSHFDRPGFLKMNKVVVFSLFGDRAMDRDGALANALSVPLYYLTWRAVFVVDESIPPEFQNQLREAGADVVPAPSNCCSDWGNARQILRYLMLGDSTIQYAMFRDADSRISAREISSVNAWLYTNKTFHIMRDHPNHRFIMGGGMWGVQAATLRAKLSDIPSSIVNYVEERKNQGCCIDQRWLQDVIWPLIGDDVVDHDSFHCGEYNSYSTPFPLPRDYHGDFVGLVQDSAATEPLTNGNLALWPEYKLHGEAIFKQANPEHCRLQTHHIYG